MCGFAERSHHVGEHIAGFERTEFVRRNAHSLHHERDVAFFGVGFSNGQGHTFAVWVGADDDKMSGFACTCDEWCFDDKAEYVFRELALFYYSVHNLYGRFFRVFHACGRVFTFIKQS